MSFWEYTALVQHHQPDDDTDAVDAPDADRVAAQFARLAERGLVTGSTH